MKIKDLVTKYEKELKLLNNEKLILAPDIRTMAECQKPLLKHFIQDLKSIGTEMKFCTNCGCGDPKKTYDGYWCKMCKTEL